MSEFNEGNARLSPDGRWITYFTNVTGRDEVHVARFPSGSQDIAISSGGGTFAVWSPDGKKILFTGPGGLFSVDVDVGAASPFGMAQVVPLGSWEDLIVPGHGFDVAADGRLLLVTKHGAPTITSLRLLEGWQSPR